MIRKFIWIIGPMAVGKMTVGEILASRTGYQFLHNHISIEFALEFFEHGTPGFRQINGGIRELVFDTISKYEENGFIFTFVWDFASEEDHNYVRMINEKFMELGWEIYYIELEASIETRKERNKHHYRISKKPSKRNIERTENELDRALDIWLLNSNDDFPYPNYHLKINNENLLPELVVSKIIEFCGINNEGSNKIF